MDAFTIRKRSALICFSLLIPAFSVLAQQNYSLQNLVDAAQKHVPLLQQKQSLINAGNATITDVKHSFLPQVRASEQLNIGTDNSLSGSYFTFGITPSTSAGVRASNTLDPATGNVAVVYSEYELYNFGLNHARLNNARSNVDFQQADLQKEQYFLQLEVARLYFNILKNKYRLQTDQQNVARYDSIYSIIRALTTSGIKAGSDSSLAQAELSKTHITYTQTLGTFNQLKEQMAYYTGIPARQMIIDTLSSILTDKRVDLADSAITADNNPLINYYNKRKAIFVANELLIKKSYLPKVMLASALWARGSSIQYNDNYKALTNGLSYQRFNYAVGLAFTYNLFNGFYKKDKLLINRYQTEAAGFELQQQREALALANSQADNAMQTTQDNLSQLIIQLLAAQATYQQKVAQYKAGIISLIDVTNASFVLYRSQTDYIETVSDWYRAQLDKAAATGNLNQFIQTIK